MKVLILSVWYPSAVNPIYGSFVREFARALAGFAEVVVVSPVPSAEALEGKKLPYMEEFTENGVRTFLFYYKKTAFLNKLRGFFYFVKAVKLVLKSGFNPDVVNAHVHYSALPALYIKELKSVPLAVSEHSSVFLSEKGPGLFGRLLAKFIFKRASVVLPVSEALKKSLLKYTGKTPVEVIPNTYDNSLFKPEDKSERKGKNLLFVGTLVSVKGVDILLKGFALVKDKSTLLDIVGDGKMRREYEALAKDLGISGRVKFHGFLPKTDVADLMSKSSIFVLASRSETFGCVLMEAAGAGLPVVATRVGGVSEVVNEKTGILVDPESPEALAKGIDQMLSKLYKFSPAEVSAEAQSRFSHEVVGEIMLNGFTKLLK